MRTCREKLGGEGPRVHSAGLEPLDVSLAFLESQVPLCTQSSEHPKTSPEQLRTPAAHEETAKHF